MDECKEFCERNLTYLFMPFFLDETICLSTFTQQLQSSSDWDSVGNNCSYMFRYISDKLKFDPNHPEERLCAHYALHKNEDRSTRLSGKQWRVSRCQYGCSGSLSFTIRDVHLFCFRTRLCIAALEIESSGNDVIDIAALQFCLKAAGKCTMTRVDDSAVEVTPVNFLREQLQGILLSPENADFTFFSDEYNIRSNILSLTTRPAAERETAKLKRDLFYLRHCYNETFVYAEENDTRAEEEICSFVSDIYWGITSEVSACVALVSETNRQFICGAFSRNFSSQYLLMYVLLLHQKYTLYRFMTRIGRGEQNTLKKLEKYREELYAFETDYMFSRITEVPQYQLLYEQISRAFSLNELYNDVHEPIQELRDLRISSRDKKLNLALTALSLLSAASAIADGFALIKELRTLYSVTRIPMWSETLWLGIVLLSLILVLYHLLRRN